MRFSRALMVAAIATAGAACGGGSAARQTRWPGDATVQVVDNADTFGKNLSGLVAEGSGGPDPGTLWAIRNEPAALFRLRFDGTNWVTDDTNAWSAGKALEYPDGKGEPDAEDLTYAGSSANDGIFVVAERDNDDKSVSRNSILRFDPAGQGSTLTATDEWNLTADLPPTDPNVGLEAITWVPDNVLVAQHFFDEHAQHAYDPGEYPHHGTGLFFVGFEANGKIYAYAFNEAANEAGNEAGNDFSRIATIATPFDKIMALQFDRDLNNLWVTCDKSCSGQHAVLRIDSAQGKFTVVNTFERPSEMADYNNEGFAIAPASECIANRKPVYWADDAQDDGHAIRRGTVPCDSPTIR